MCISNWLGGSDGFLAQLFGFCYTILERGNKKRTVASPLSLLLKMRLRAAFFYFFIHPHNKGFVECLQLPLTSSN